MKSPESNFLKTKYDLHNAPEVEKAAERTEIQTGEKVPQDPISQIDNYLHRFREITDRTDPEAHERGVQALEKKAHELFVIKPEEVPESYFALQQRIAREQGHGDVEIDGNVREQMREAVVADQASSLDTWIDYFASSDSRYFPDAMKYWAFRSMLKLSSYDKEKHQFDTRGKGTTTAFPDLDREALAYVGDVITKKIRGEVVNNPTIEVKDEDFKKIVTTENFGKLYAFALEHVTKDPSETLENTAGEWVKYPQGDDYMPLVESLQGHGTGWCTAGESFASAQLQGGDFYVYYSYDKNGKPIIPRAAIRMEGDRIGEVRGIAHNQNLDPYVGPVVQEKLKDFPDGNAYEKKATDMMRLTAIEQKTKANEELTHKDLRFLYEMDAPIRGFGYFEDPRIHEMCQTRNPVTDMRTILESEAGKKVGDDEVAIELMSHRDRWEHLIIPEKFPDLAFDSQFVKKLIDADKFGFVLRHIELFPNGVCDADIANYLIKKGEVTTVADYIFNFLNLTPEIARAVFSAKSVRLSTPGSLIYGETETHDPRKIFDMSPEEVFYEYLLNRPDYLREYEMSSEPFLDVDYDALAERLIHEDHADKIYSLLPGLTKPLPEKIAQDIILSHRPYQIEFHLDTLVNGLTQSTLFALIDEEGGLYELLPVLKWFRNINYSKLLDKLLTDEKLFLTLDDFVRIRKLLDETNNTDEPLHARLDKVITEWNPEAL